MGYGPISAGGKQTPITPWEGSWAATVNNPIAEHVKRAFQDQFAATHSQRMKLSGTYDQEGRKLS